MKSEAPNPAGREGKPISLAPMKFEDALRKILAAPPPPKSEHHATKKSAKRPTKKKR